MDKSIWQRRGELDRARSKKMTELMQEYDETEYYPARRQLMRECFQQGHSGGKFHHNGIGWTWFYCGKCGGRYNITGPAGKTEPDDGATA